MDGFIVYPTYRITDGKAQVLLFGRLSGGESFVSIHDFRPYFWIREKDHEKANRILTELDAKNVEIEASEFRNFDDDPVAKVILSIPGEVPELRKIFTEHAIPSYEADIRFAYRFLIDHNIKGCMRISGKTEERPEFAVDKVFVNPEIAPTTFDPKLRVLSLDIETDVKGAQVYAISLYSDRVKKVLLLNERSYRNAESFSTEKELLEAFANAVRQEDPDIITGWNLVDFDLKLLRDQFARHGLPFILGRTLDECKLRLTDSFYQDSTADFPGRAVLDGMRLLKMSFIKLDDYKLNTAAKMILGQEKLLIGDNRFEEIERLYREDTQKLVDYNLKDAQLVFDIIQKSQALDLSIRRSQLTRMQLDRVSASIASFDSLYLHALKEKRIVAPTAIVNEREERIKGGFVMESKPGVYDTIIVLDFKSLYPSIIRTFNIDPYSFVPKERYAKIPDEEKAQLIEAPNGAHFRNDNGILPELIQHLWQQRDAAKKRKDMLASQAIKILMNSYFGILANPACRFYNLEMANAITHFGQFLNKLTAEKVREQGYEVIYGDTDSIFIDAPGKDLSSAEKLGRELEQYINAFYKAYVRKTFNRESFIELEFDRAFSKFLMPRVRHSDEGAKKRYAGLVVEDGREDIVVVGLEFVRRDWTEVAKKFQMGLLHHIFHDKPMEQYIRQFVADLRQGKMDADLIYRKAIRKGVAEYTKTTPPHIKAARKLGRELPGLIEYVMTLDGPEPLEKNSRPLDYDHYIEKQIKPIADSILSFQDKSFDDIVATHKQTDLSKFG